MLYELSYIDNTGKKHAKRFTDYYKARKVERFLLEKGICRVDLAIILDVD